MDRCVIYVNASAAVGDEFRSARSSRCKHTHICTKHPVCEDEMLNAEWLKTFQGGNTLRLLLGPPGGEATRVICLFLSHVHTCDLFNERFIAEEPENTQAFKVLMKLSSSPRF